MSWPCYRTGRCGAQTFKVNNGSPTIDRLQRSEQCHVNFRAVLLDSPFVCLLIAFVSRRFVNCRCYWIRFFGHRLEFNSTRSI